MRSVIAFTADWSLMSSAATACTPGEAREDDDEEEEVKGR